MNKELIPNFLTLSNCLFGFLSIITTANGKLIYSSVFIILAMLADRYDGIVARKLGVTSAIGKELDSLCDAVSFGVAPALLVYTKSIGVTDLVIAKALILIICGAYACCGVYRLARFNVSTLTGGFYQGVPITTCGCILAILSFSFINVPSLALLILTAIFSYLMVSNIKIKKI
ncbi:CDP-diacylglycerol--serine O-phosphatidyltransferase [Gemella sp. GH3]|uniref:CDP-diacylglycerol--serine O-phosphatidyltransferase n=1 Tax=unclassified Gemella TaxID=2624949 RepID=UPI0015CFDEDF|nr:MULTISPECIES: CDP-diacylglycerol--serine O-phosphatidyltransferase [unclassified Gemella]MBF0714121.1 CDP-diacylglycerol--serine O-phosphatidyltransferase [Gemella sp. GH3.1]NYS51073.1 CDP-diacylglycerol--serine O-phosphatidyltransferase [Gemella sp. GH3]